MRVVRAVPPLTAGLLSLALLCPAAEAPALAAKAKKAAPAAPQVAGEKTTRAVGELAGKFKWGMSAKECMDIIEKDIRSKTEPKIRAEPDPFKQDIIRKEMMESINEMRNSLTRFDGQRSGWDVSIVDREFGHKNDESMLVIWEANQRRFLFFWQDKLYKQFIALPAERFKGKTFEEFAEIIQERYGKAQINFAKMQTQDEMALDFLEWPPAGEHVLRAYDYSSFYGNFCLSIMHKSVYPLVDKERAQKSPRRGHQINTAIVDTVSQGDSPGDPNADIVDEVLGRQGLRTNQGGGTEKPAPAPKNKKKK
jgi:hypothetical protein